MDRVNQRASLAQLRLAAVVSLLAFVIAGCDSSSDPTSSSPRTPWVDAPCSGVVNRAPGISGQPPTSAQVNVSYEFKPSATDPDGDELRFEIAGKPAWATFDTRTGRLAGTPSASSVGKFENIQIVVSDGTARSALPAFTITVSETGGGLGSATLLGGADTNQHGRTPDRPRGVSRVLRPVGVIAGPHRHDGNRINANRNNGISVRTLNATVPPSGTTMLGNLIYSRGIGD